MYSKEENIKFRRDFWTSFGIYMRKHQTVGDQEIKWLNYNTRVKDLIFRTAIEEGRAEAAIILKHSGENARSACYEHFLSLQDVLNTIFECELIWPEEGSLTDQEIRIYAELNNVRIQDKSAWLTYFQFFEKHLLRFDRFWFEFSELFKV